MDTVVTSEMTVEGTKRLMPRVARNLEDQAIGKVDAVTSTIASFSCSNYFCILRDERLMIEQGFNSIG